MPNEVIMSPNNKGVAKPTMPRGEPLTCATLNLSWEANSTKKLHPRAFRNVPVKNHVAKRAPGKPFSQAYHISAETLLKAGPDIILLQEFSVPTSLIATPQDTIEKAKKEAIEKTKSLLFNDKYVVVASKLIEINGTLFGNMVLASASKAALYDFVDLQGADYYSLFHKRFGNGRPLAAAVMHKKGNPASPIMLLCSAHSAHGMQWDLKSSQRTLSKIVAESIAAYMHAFQQPLPIDFSGMGVLFGGDLNTTLSNQCKWGRAVTIDVLGETFTFYKAASSSVRQATLTTDTTRVPRDWIFCTSSASADCNPAVCVDPKTGSDHYAVFAQTKAAMGGLAALRKREFVDVPAQF